VVGEFFLALRGSGLLLSPLDQELVAEWERRGLPVPVVIAGGSPSGGIECFLERIEMSVRAGASGVAAGRGIFQHEDPGAILRAVCDIIHRGVSAAKIMEDMKAEAKTWTKRT